MYYTHQYTTYIDWHFQNGGPYFWMAIRTHGISYQSPFWFHPSLMTQSPHLKCLFFFIHLLSLVRNLAYTIVEKTTMLIIFLSFLLAPLTICADVSFLSAKVDWKRGISAIIPTVIFRP